MSTTPSHFIWYELMTHDIEAAANFYGAVIGWSVSGPPPSGQDYRQWSIGGETIGGLLAIDAEGQARGMPAAWFGYLNVPDVDEAVAAILADGGAVHVPAWDIAGVGRMAVVADPQEAGFYVMTPIGEGPSPSFGPGRPGHGGWHELRTTDAEAACDFYERRFGWGRSDAIDMGAMGVYQLFNAGGQAIGGMMSVANGSRPMWLYYFTVEDIHAASSRVEAAGGVVLIEPQQVPGGSWTLRARDPQGAMFALVGPAPASAAR